MSMYCEDRILSLADAAIMVDKDEQLRRLLTKKLSVKLSEQSEPRKTLSSLRAKSKIICEEEEEEDDDDEEDENKLSKIASRSYPQPSFVNWGSTSSRYPNRRCRKPEKTEEYPPSPNYKSSSPSSCLTEVTSRKRGGVPQRKSEGGSKRAMVDDPLPCEPRQTPEWVLQVIREMGRSRSGPVDGDAENPRLVFEKTLTMSDVDPGQSRLLIPFNQLFINDFLTLAECSRAIDGLGTLVVNKMRQEWGMRLKIWPMGKKSKKGTLHYALNKGWNALVRGNNLEERDNISLWTFRCGGEIRFAIDHIVRKST